MYSNMGPTYPKFDASYHLHDDHRPPFMRDFHRPGLPPHLSQRSPSSAPWRPQVSDFNLLVVLTFTLDSIYLRLNTKLNCNTDI